MTCSILLMFKQGLLKCIFFYIRKLLLGGRAEAFLISVKNIFMQ